MMVGCGTTIVKSELPCPPRPVLQAFTIVELNLMAGSTQEKIASNQIKLQSYSKKLEVRASCEGS